uniref:Uncharacterized protein n=1 Tax=Panagrolaimus sp. ES5 TaxID=591445 RepID=A0AC34FZR7_9BILA
MIFTTIALITAIIATYKFLKARRASGVTLLSYRYTGNFPDLRNLYNNGQEINLQAYDTVHFDNDNGNVTILSSKN